MRVWYSLLPSLASAQNSTTEGSTRSMSEMAALKKSPVNTVVVGPFMVFHPSSLWTSTDQATLASISEYQQALLPPLRLFAGTDLGRLRWLRSSAIQMMMTLKPHEGIVRWWGRWTLGSWVFLKLCGFASVLLKLEKNYTSLLLIEPLGWQSLPIRRCSTAEKYPYFSWSTPKLSCLNPTFAWFLVII